MPTPITLPLQAESTSYGLRTVTMINVSRSTFRDRVFGPTPVSDAEIWLRSASMDPAVALGSMLGHAVELLAQGHASTALATLRAAAALVQQVDADNLGLQQCVHGYLPAEFPCSEHAGAPDAGV